VRSHEREVGIVAGVLVEVRAAGHIIRYSREGERLRCCEFGGRFWGGGTEDWIPAFAGMTGWGRGVPVVCPCCAKGCAWGSGLGLVVWHTCRHSRESGSPSCGGFGV